LSREGLVYLQRCAREYGDVVRFQFFWKPIVFVNCPDLIEKVLLTNHRKVVKNIAQRYHLELVPGHPVVPEMIPTLRLKYGMRMMVHKR
jgi:hypothetical protein